MAKTRRKRKKESLGGYFRSVLTENPEWLDIKSNDLMKARYEADHPGKVFTKGTRANLANVKSVLRKKLGKGKRKAGKTRAAFDASVYDLEGLEVAIDDCLSAARRMDPVGLAEVIKSLRRARNNLVWKMGES